MAKAKLPTDPVPWRTIDVSYGHDLGRPRLELAIPQGMKVAELAKLDKLVFEAIAKLPRGCQACLSGEPLFIREKFDDVVRIDLEQQRILGR